MVQNKGMHGANAFQSMLTQQDAAKGSMRQLTAHCWQKGRLTPLCVPPQLYIAALYMPQASGANWIPHMRPFSSLNCQKTNIRVKKISQFAKLTENWTGPGDYNHQVHTLYPPCQSKGKGGGHKPQSKALLSAANSFWQLSCRMKPHSNHSLILQVWTFT